MSTGDKLKLAGHTTLDGVGMVPVVGEFANGANAIWYAAEGDWADAAGSAAAMVPVGGEAADAVKLAADGEKIYKATHATEDAVEGGQGVAKLADGATPPEAAPAGGTPAPGEPLPPGKATPDGSGAGGGGPPGAAPPGGMAAAGGKPPVEEPAGQPGVGAGKPPTPQQPGQTAAADSRKPPTEPGPQPAAPAPGKPPAEETGGQPAVGAAGAQKPPSGESAGQTAVGAGGKSPAGPNAQPATTATGGGSKSPVGEPAGDTGIPSPRRAPDDSLAGAGAPQRVPAEQPAPVREPAMAGAPARQPELATAGQPTRLGTPSAPSGGGAQALHGADASEGGSGGTALLTRPAPAPRVGDPASAEPLNPGPPKSAPGPGTGEPAPLGAPRQVPTRPGENPGTDHSPDNPPDTPTAPRNPADTPPANPGAPDTTPKTVPNPGEKAGDNPGGEVEPPTEPKPAGADPTAPEHPYDTPAGHPTISDPGADTPGITPGGKPARGAAEPHQGIAEPPPGADAPAANSAPTESVGRRVADGAPIEGAPPGGRSLTDNVGSDDAHDTGGPGEIQKVGDFRDEYSAFTHYTKHVKGTELGRNGSARAANPDVNPDMPEFKSFDEYRKAARGFMGGGRQNGVLEGMRPRDGRLVRFDPSTGYFGVRDSQGQILTFFRPARGIDYFREQFNTPGGG